MLCDYCKKREVSVRYTQVINGIKREMHLCEDCSRKLGIQANNFSMPIDFTSFLGDFVENYMDALSPLLQEKKTLVCDKCNRSYEDFMESGKFGCDHCYEVFEKQISPLLKRLQGDNQYSGKVIQSQKKNTVSPKEQEKSEGNEEKIRTLKLKIKECIRLEKYEEAAKIRDEIKDLEKLEKGE